MIRALVLLYGAAALALAGCADRPVQAPVVDRAPPGAARPSTPVPPPPAAAARPDSYTVRRGDTLYSIALDQGHDYKELAAWNNLEDPNRIRIGQQLRLKPPEGVQETPVTVSPVSSTGPIEARPLAPGAVKEEVPGSAPAGEEQIKSEPLARKLPYSPENVALLQHGEPQLAPHAGAARAPAAAAPEATPPAAVAPAATPPVVAPPAAAPKPEPAGKTDAEAEDADKLDWGRPAQGKVLAAFSEPANKGVDIGGKLGDPVIAAATGRVIYSGEMRGYGKLAVIKHNKTYSSVYAHNRDILVKEGQNVVKGQKIAEIGNTDADAPKLHFEIRKLGKPVDPAKYLPPL